MAKVVVRFFDDETLEGVARDLDFDEPDFLVEVDDAGGLDNNETAWIPLTAVKWVELARDPDLASETPTRKVAIRFLDGEVLRGHLDGTLERHRYGVVLHLHAEQTDSPVRKLGIPFAGRIPLSVSVIEASDSGQRSVEQEDDLMRACTSREGAFRAQLTDTANRRTGDDPLQLRSQARAILSSYDPRQCRLVMETLVRNHTWVTPTLVAYQPYARSFDSASRHPELSKNVAGIVEGGWQHKVLAVPKPDSFMVQSSFSFERSGALSKAGVGLLAGTDAPRAFIYPGFSLHEELALLVRSGLTPLEALRTATYNPASYLGALDSLGTIATGKIADLVLLDANPLDDIHNTTRISVVIANGRVFDSTARAALLRHVATALKRD